MGGPIVKDRALVLRRVPLIRRAELHRRHVHEPPARRAAVLREPGRMHASAASSWCPTRRIVDSPAVGGDTWTRGETLNLTWQADQKNKITVFGHFNQRLVDCNQCSATTSPEAGDVLHASARVHRCRAPGAIRTRTSCSSKAGFTFYNERWIFGPRAGQHRTAYGPDAVVSKIEIVDRERSTARPTSFTTAANHQYNMRAAVNYVTGSHAFKFGMQDMWGTRNYRYDTNQSQAWISHRRRRPRSPSTRDR